MGKEKKKPTLADRIEKLSTSTGPVDSLDPDLLSHIRYFFSKPIPTLENFSLETPELAKDALAQFEATREMLEEKLHTVRALKKMAQDNPEE
jgi:hypothetical protein